MQPNRSTDIDIKPPVGGSSVVPGALKITVDTTEIDKAIEKAQQLVDLLIKANDLMPADNQSSQVVLGLLTREVVIEHSPEFTEAQIQDVLSKFQYYDKSRPNYVYSKGYIAGKECYLIDGSNQ